MKKFYLSGLSLFLCVTTFAQNLTVPPNGGNKRAVVGEMIGITNVTIHYNRPGVKGREGKIWNGLVHTGFTDLGFGTSKQSPWRAGANENTVIEFSSSVLVENKSLPAGKYGLFVAMGNGDATIIFSKNSTSWGSYFYDPKEDALRVEVKTKPLNESVEWMKYEFTDQTDSSAVIALQWEKLKIPFEVKVNMVETQMAMFEKELRSDKGFNSTAWVQAAQYALAHSELDKALEWSDYSISGVFVGERNFRTLSTKAMILERQGKSDEAKKLMQEALPLGSMAEVHQYGRQLIAAKKPAEAMDVFKLNAKNHPNDFMTLVGLARGYSALGDYKNALKYAKLAAPLAPDQLNKDSLASMIEKLSAGSDVN